MCGPRLGIRTKDLGAADETLYATPGYSGKVGAWLRGSERKRTETREYLSATAPMRVVRPVSADDGPALVEFHRQLSGRAHFPRYFSEYRVLNSDEIQHLTYVDGWNRVALVAEINDALIALGRYDRLSDPLQAQVAFAVADAYQHQYIASELLRRLAHAARMADVSQFKAEVLPQNATMLAVFEEAGFPVSSSIRRRGSIEMTLDIVSSLQPSSIA